ncbi:MAG: M6 family metalloprotease domain-containing protein, partial [bacterium]|nr:M6 family metalloprotease domain-containing protein [bacterium]
MASTRVSTVVRGVLVSCVAVSLLATGPRASAAPTFGEVFELLQPNGSLVSVRIWGDEFYGVTETLDGYAVVRDPQTRFFCYAELSADGNDLVSTGVRLGQTVPAGLAPHLRINPAAAMAKIQDARAEFEEIQARTQAARGGLRGPSIGDVAGITLLIDFPEEAGVIPQADVDNYCNQVGYSGNSNNGSIRDYFFDVSGGALTYTNFVTAYYTAANPKSYYTDETIPWGDRGEDLTKEALNALETAGFDFSAYDADSDTKLDALNMFYVGEHGNNWAEGLWPGSIGFNTTWTADGIDVERFQMTNMGGGLTIATFCHENGHMLMGWPDLYDYSDPGPEDSAGVGQFCLMCSAASATNPVQPCGPLKMRVGWTTTHALTTCQKDLTVTAGTNPNEIYKFDNPGNAQEYYILENRQQTGRDTWIPDAGLAIWHVDEAGSNTNQEMTLALHYNVTLVQADGLWHLENNVNSGDTDDLWGAPAYTECTPTTNPKTDWWDDSDSGLVVRSISSPAPTMTFTYCNNLENTPPVARCTASTISKVADTSCCIPVAVGEVDNGSSDDDGASDIDTLCITEVDGASVGCAQSVQVCGYPDGAHTVKLTITDLSGEESSCVANVEVRDETPPVITVFPADQDLQCLAELPAEDTSLVQATDNCTDPNDIIKGVASETNNGGSGCVGDPLIIERVYQATDEAGLSTFRTQTFTVVDDTIPTIDGAITNAVKPIEVDGNCTAYVEFSVTVTDNCCVDPADVVVAAQVLTDNATLGDVEYDPFPPSAPSVTVTGRVLVSDLTCCPATVQLAFDATDCCSNGGAQDTDVVDVIDNYPPIG